MRPSALSRRSVPGSKFVSGRFSAQEGGREVQAWNMAIYHVTCSDGNHWTFFNCGGAGVNRQFRFRCILQDAVMENED